MKRRFTWADLTPFPGNPIYPKRVDKMRRTWGGYDSSNVGSPAVFDNTANAYPDYPPETLFIGDGNHRRELAQQDGRLGEEVLVDLHRGLTRTEMHKRRRGLNDRRTVKPAETFLHLVEEEYRTQCQIKETVESLGWAITYERQEGGLACTNELEWIWESDHAALVRAIQTYEKVFGRDASSAQATVIKGLGAFWIKYPDADLDRLARSLKGVTAKELYTSGRSQAQDLSFLRNVYDGIRYSLWMGYNKVARAGKLAA